MFAQIFIDGLQDSLEPLPLLTLLLFFLFILFTGRSRLRVFCSGIFFIFTLLLMNYFLVLGGFDLSLSRSIVTRAIQFAYGIIALTFIVLGAFYFFDWYQYKRRPGVYTGMIKHAVFLTNSNPVPKNKISLLSDILWASFGGIALGFLGTVLSSISVQDYVTFMNFSQVFAREGREKALLSLGYYSIGFIFLILVIWIIFLVIMTSAKIKAILRAKAVASFLRIIFSAVFLATGIGVGYMLIKSVNIRG